MYAFPCRDYSSGYPQNCWDRSASQLKKAPVTTVVGDAAERSVRLLLEEGGAAGAAASVSSARARGGVRRIECSNACFPAQVVHTEDALVMISIV